MFTMSAPTLAYSWLRDQLVARIVWPVGHLVLLVGVYGRSVLAHLGMEWARIVELVAGWGGGAVRRVVWLGVLAVGEHSSVLGDAGRVGRAVVVGVGVVVVVSWGTCVEVETAVGVSVVPGCHVMYAGSRLYLLESTSEWGCGSRRS